MLVLISTIAALIPTLLYTLLLWWLDRHEKEPLPLLAAAFVWGALPALFLAVIAEIAVGSTVADVFGPGSETTIAAPVIEETLKALALIGIFIFARREFDGVLDGIIYGALVGFGFAMSENILYFIAYADQLGTVWVLRAVIFGFNHAFFTSIVGIALGLVRYERRRWVGYVAVPVALWLAMLLHALHNSSAQLGGVGLALAWIVDSGGMLIVLATAVLAHRHELYWTTTQLGDEVARGVITPAHYYVAQHPSARVRVELRALMDGGWSALRETHRFYHQVIELAFIKYQVGRGDRFCTPDDISAVRAEVLDARAKMEELAPHLALRS
jgi:protease PrsW